MTIQGLLLAAGAGTRMGMPKALKVGDDGVPWLVRSVQSLREGGCHGVTVVLGAAAEDAVTHLAGLEVTTVLAEDWAEGMSASLRAGLQALDHQQAAEVAVISLVDLPDVSADVVRRCLDLGPQPATLARAAYDGRPGHPVVLGRDHWDAVSDRTSGDAGARDYLAEHSPLLVECGDLATGEDRDRPGP